MSLWGATVITNLISAIPWIGQDVVESNNITIIINLCLGSTTFVIFLLIITIYGASLYLFSSKIMESKDSLPTIGVIHQNALKKSNKTLRWNKKEYISIPSSFIAFLVGLIDGDGYIQVTKTSKGFITIKLVISLHIEDISTLEYIHSVLNIGKINVYKDLRSPTCKLVINKTDLQEIMFPLLIYHNIFFLTITRIDQFNLAMYIMKNDIKIYNQIPNINNIPAVFEIPKNPIDYTLLHFFRNWIVGFTCPSLYPGVIEFAKANPLTYKRVKRDFKKLCNKDSYNSLKRIYLLQQREINSANKKYFSTYAAKQNKYEVVVWGSNLRSTAGTGRLTKIVKNMIVLPPFEKSVVVGILLSDGNLSSSKPHENPHLAFKQGLNNSKYVLWVYSILSHYCNVYPSVVKSIRVDKTHCGLYFRTRGLPCFGELRSLFYKDRKKVVPENIYYLLTPIALAHVIMGDGVAKSHGLIICTDSYSTVDVVRIMNVLMIKYGLECTLRYHRPTHPRIYIRQCSMPIVRELVKPYMAKSRLYKIGL